MNNNEEMLRLAGINEATDYVSKSGSLGAILWQIRSSLNIALDMVEGKRGSSGLSTNPQRALNFLKDSVRKALEQSDEMEKRQKDVWDGTRS